MNGMTADLSFTWDSPMPFGKYKFHKLKDIPAKYLIMLYESKCRNNIYLYDWLCRNIEDLKLKSVGCDSTLFVPEPVPFICEKITYPTEAEAKFHLRNIKTRGGEHKKPYRAYECPKCSGWHLTSKEHRKFKQS